MDDNGETFAGQAMVFEPQMLASFDHRTGDVNEMQFLNADLLAVASSDGSVTLLKVQKDIVGSATPSTGISLSKANHWPKIHTSCNGLSVSGDHIMSIGNEGKMFLLNVKRQSPIQTFAKADSGSLSCALFLRQDQIAAANSRGQVKIWDLRVGNTQDKQEPAKVCHLAMDLVGVTSLAKHPTQPHVLVGGGSNGVLGFWDLRGTQDYPLSVVKAHSEAVSEVHFHDQQPDHMFSCSQSGETWHWNGSHLKLSTAGPNQKVNSCIWLNSEMVKNRIDTKPMMTKQALPINSMSIMGQSVLVAGDSEAIFLIPDIGL